MTNIFKDGTLCSIHVSYWSGAKILKPEDLGLKETDIATAYRLGRKYLIPEEVIQKFRTIEQRARRAVEKSSYEFPIGNSRFVTSKALPGVMEDLKKYQAEYNALVDDLVTNYDKYREEMVPVYVEAAYKAFETQEPTQVATFSLEDKDEERKRFMTEFMNRIALHYPMASALRSKYSLHWDVFTIAPATMEGSSDTTSKKVDDFVTDVIRTLRQETIDLCTKITSSIKEGKIVKGRTLNSLKDFITRFKEMDFVGDKKLEENLETLQNDFLSIYSDEEVKDGDVQDELFNRLDAITKSVEDFTDIDLLADTYKAIPF